VNAPSTCELVLEPADNERLAVLCGPLDEHLRQIETRLSVGVHRRGNVFLIEGARAADAGRILEHLYGGGGRRITPRDVHLAIQESGMAEDATGADADHGEVKVATPRPDPGPWREPSRLSRVDPHRGPHLRNWAGRYR